MGMEGSLHSLTLCLLLSMSVCFSDLSLLYWGFGGKEEKTPQAIYLKL